MHIFHKTGWQLLLFVLCLALILPGCKKGSDVPLSPGLSMIEGVATYEKDVAVKTEHFTVTPGMMAYFFYTYATNVLSEITKDHLYDSSCLLHDQMYDETRSYYDMIMNETLSRVCKMLICCEAAYAEGVALSEAQVAQVEEQMTAGRVKAASEYGIEYDAYLQRLYGKQITAADMESILTLELLASSFSKTLSGRLERGITADDVARALADKASVDETPSRNIAFLFIPFTGAGVATDKVEQACVAMQSTPTTEALQTLGALGTYGEELNLTPENSGIPAIGAWLFDAERRIGDWGRVDTEGATYILLYTGNGMGYDEVRVRMSLYDAAYAAWYNAFVETLTFAYNYDCLDGYDVSAQTVSGG